MPPTPVSNPVAGLSSSAATRNRDTIEKLRARADTTAKTFGTLATTAVTAIGFAKLGDIFPREEGLNWPLWGALIGFFLMVASVAFFTARLWGVTQPIVACSDPNLMSDLRRNEPKIVEKVYNDAAVLRLARTLRDYEARAWRFTRIADRRPSTEASPLRERAAAIRDDVNSATSRAAVLVVRRRAGRVVKSFLSAVFFLAFAAGTVAFAVSSDRMESARASEIAVAKSCAEARTAKAREDQLPQICGEDQTDEDAQLALAIACAQARAAKAIEAKLPFACGKPADEEQQQTASAEEAADAALTALAEARGKCRAAYRKQDSSGADPCAVFDTAISTLVSR